jgi:two-component system sensor histidine kinase BaeS
MLRSVRSRVVLLTIGVAVVAVVATAWLAIRNVESSLRDNVSQGLESDVMILQSLTDYGITHPSWDGVDDVIAQLAELTGRRIALVHDGDVVADSDELAGRDASPLPPAPSAVVDPASPSAVLFAPIVFSSPTPLDAEVSIGSNNVGASVGVGAAAGELSSMTLDEVAGALQVTDGFVVEGVSVPADAVGTAEVVPMGDMAPRAQLYLGRRTEDPLSLSGDGRWRTLGIVGIVLAVAAALAWVFGRHLTKPLDDLATAAHRMRGGDLSGRVAVPAGGELGEVARAFNSMASSLEATQEQRRRMTTDIAHELRNPLVTINGTLEAIQDGLYEPDAAVIASLVEETDHLRSLVDDLQQLSLAESGALRLHREPTSLLDLAEQVVSAQRSAAAAAGVSVTASGDDIASNIDPRRIRQVLGNLVANAVRHTPDGGSVTVAVAPHGDSGVIVSVTDTGCGIAADDVPHVFDRLWRADASRTRGGGTGLGLAISQELVRLHDGTIGVSSEVGVGSVFTVTLQRTSELPLQP